MFRYFINEWIVPIDFDGSRIYKKVTIVQINTNLLDTGVRVPSSPRHLHQGLDKEGCCAVYPDRDTDLKCQDPAGCDDDAGVPFARHCETLEHKFGAGNDQDQDGAELKHSVSKGLDQRLETEALRSSHRVSEDGCQTCDEDAREQDRDAAECESDGLPDDGNLIAVCRVAFDVAHPEYLPVHDGQGDPKKNNFHEAGGRQAAA
ncbi:hypothetical protein MMC29_000820 [Sticta canariensis]|nr:hypothetical protein [Sticta canariensis]